MATIERSIILAPLTTFKVGGSADYFCSVQSTSDLAEAVSFARTEKLPIFLLGGGSNILVSDDGFRGLVIKMDIKGIESQTKGNRTSFHVAAGEDWDDFVARTVSNGFYDFANLSGIPGSVGGAPVQNIGAYGSEMKDCATDVEAVHFLTGEKRIFDNDACCFGYRDSFFKTENGRGYAITHVTFTLDRSCGPNIAYRDVAEYFAHSRALPSPADIRTAILEIRSKKFPDLRQFGTAGSFFKNPIVAPATYDSLKKKFPGIPAYDVEGDRKKISAGWLIDRVGGWRGVEENGISSFKNQALVLVNTGSTRGEDIRSFAEKIRADIKLKTDVELEYEVQLVGF